MNPMTIITGVSAAMRLAQAGLDIYERWQKGDLPPDEAEAEWKKTQAAFAKGAAAWDAAAPRGGV